MKIMCDTNVILDVLLDRQPFADDSSRVFELCERGVVKGFITASTATDIFFLTHRHFHDTERTYFAFGKLLEIFKIAPVTNAEILEAYLMRFPDFEDALLSVCAQKMSCDFLVTRNVKDFKGASLKCLEPKAFLQSFFGAK